MRFTSVLLAVCCCLSAVRGQWLEKMVWLPDSFGGMDGPNALAFDARDRVVYVAGSSPALVAVNCSTEARVARIPLRARARSLCYDSAANELYAAHDDGLLSVVDCSANAVVATIELPVAPGKLVLAPAGGKVYFETNDSGIGVVDCPSHSFAKFISTDRSERFCPVRSRNRLYYWEGRGGGIGVVDCSTDSVIAVISLDVNPQMVFCESEDKLYVHDHDYDQVLVVDAATNTLVDSLPDLAGNENCNPLCLNSRLNRLYCANADGPVTVIDCENDSVIDEIGPFHVPFQPCINESLNRLYVRTSSPERLTMIDCVTNSVVASVPMPGWCYDTTLCIAALGRVYATSSMPDFLTLVDCAGDTISSVVATGLTPWVIRSIPGHGKLYCTEKSGGALLVVDAASGNIIRSIAPGGSMEMLYHPTTDRVYRVSNQDSTVCEVFDPDTDSLVAVIRGPEDFEPTACNTVNGKLYCLRSTSQNLLVVDGIGDSVRTSLLVSDYPYAVQFSRSANKAYVASGDGLLHNYLTIVDGVTDAVRRELLLGSGGFAAMACNDDLNLVYCACEGQLHAIDGAGDNVVASVPAGWSDYLLYNSKQRALYCLGGRSVVVRDPVTLLPTDSIPLLVRADSLLLDTIANKLYCHQQFDDSLQVIDCATNRTSCVLGLLPEAASVAWCPEQRRVFVAHGSQSVVSVVRDTAVAGVAQPPMTSGSRLAAVTTVVRGVLYLPAHGDERPATGELLDISGRKVLELKPGANNVRGLAPGVYFVREASGVKRESSRVTKVIVTR